jgi:TctA family transporter
MEEISGYLGKLGLPAAMTLILAIVYKMIPDASVFFTDKVKTLVVLVIGIVLTMVWMIYAGAILTFVSGVDCFFYGIQLGATSIGLFKVGQAVGVFSAPK